MYNRTYFPNGRSQSDFTFRGNSLSYRKSDINEGRGDKTEKADDDKGIGSLETKISEQTVF